MNISSFFTKKIYIRLTFDLNIIRTNVSSLQFMLVSHFLNKVYLTLNIASKDTDQINIDITNFKKDDIFDSLLMFLDNVLISYSGYDSNKIGNILFFIEGVIHEYDINKIQNFKKVNEFYIKFKKN